MAEHNWTWSKERHIPSEIGEGQHILSEVLDQLQRHNWVEQDIFCVNLAMEEALVNAIKHGNQQDAEKKVRVVCNLSPDRVRIEISDEGEGFNPEDIPDPTDDEHLDMASGRGILLMRSFMSKVEYNDTGNAVVMEKLRAG